MCALSHIYTHMTFRLFTQMSTPIGWTDQNRFWDQPVLFIFHPQGHGSQQSILVENPLNSGLNSWIFNRNKMHYMKFS